MTTDRQRFETLFRTHYAALTRYAIRRVGPDTAAEIVAESFLIAWRRFAEVPDEPLPWLYATARRVIANEYRRRGREGRLARRLAATGASDGADHADGVAERDRVQAAVRRLAPRDREALMLAEWEQLAPADAARVLGCSTAAYRVRLHRARRRLATLLPAEDEPVPDVPRVLAPAPSRGTR